ncbi:MAG TPA: acyl-CoA desaturase [Verrucomicrobiae bacterium]|nr:acyl-CoA desaturase [Verrucomicrobiae bacterium]
MTTATAGLAELEREFVHRGFTRKATTRILIELTVHFLIALGGLAIVIFTSSFFGRAAGLLVSTFGLIGLATNTHTSTHFASSNRRWLNQLLVFFGYPFCLALGATFWWRKHVDLHHSAPNVIGIDEDADLLPWFALTERDVAGQHGWKRWYFKHVQFWIFPLALAGNGFQMQLAGWVHLFRVLPKPALRKREHWFDLLAMSLHYLVWVALPCLFFPVSHVLIIYAIRIVLGGYLLYAVVGPGHLPAPAARVDCAPSQSDYMLQQTACTVNFHTGPIGRWLCSGLEYQIEHHLFPNISHIYYPKISPIVRDFCRRHGLPYRSYSWPKAIWLSWAVLRQAQPIHPGLESLRE